MLKPYVQQALPLLLSDGRRQERVRQGHHGVDPRSGLRAPHGGHHGRDVAPALPVLVTMDDVPRVANNICFACHNLVQAMDDVCEDEATNPLSPYFKVIREAAGHRGQGDWTRTT